MAAQGPLPGSHTGHPPASGAASPHPPLCSPPQAPSKREPGPPRSPADQPRVSSGYFPALLQGWPACPWAVGRSGFFGKSVLWVLALVRREEQGAWSQLFKGQEWTGAEAGAGGGMSVSGVREGLACKAPPQGGRHPRGSRAPPAHSPLGPGWSRCVLWQEGRNLSAHW